MAGCLFPRIMSHYCATLKQAHDKKTWPSFWRKRRIAHRWRPSTSWPFSGIRRPRAEEKRHGLKGSFSRPLDRIR